MPLPVMPINLPTFAQSNPMLESDQFMDQLRQLQLANQRQAIANQYEPQTFQDQLRQMDLANQKASAVLPYAAKQAAATANLTQNEANIDKIKSQNPVLLQHLQNMQVVATPNGYMMVNKLTGQTSPVLDSSGKAILPLRSQGLSITSTPNGGFTINQGGLAPTQSQPNTTTIGPNGNIVASPASPHSRYSTGGSTLLDTATGNAVSVPTDQTASKFQQSLAGEQLANPALKYIFSEISPDVGGLKGVGERFLGHIGRALGANTPDLNSYQSGVESGIPQVSDQLLKTYQLNATEGNRKSIVDALTPKWDDTKSSYAKRISDTIASMMYRSGSYRNFLKGGIPLQGNDIGPQVIQGLSNKLYNELLPGSAAQQNIGTQNSGFDINEAKAELARRGIK